MTSEKTINERIAVIETRCEDLPEIKKSVSEIQRDMAALKVRVAGVAAAIAVIVTTLVEIVLKFAK